MSWTSPRTYVTGEVVTAAILNVDVRDNLLQTAPALVTQDGDIVAGTAANALKRLAAMSGDVFLHEVGAWELNISALTTNDTVGGASAGVAEIKTPVTQGEAEAGTNTRFSLWSSERVKQAIAALETGARIATGTYTGDGTTSQAITGVGFQVKELTIITRVTVGGALGDQTVFYTSDTIVDDNASGLAFNVVGDSMLVDKIISLDADGFTVDDEDVDGHPNKDGQVYNYIAKG